MSCRLSWLLLLPVLVLPRVAAAQAEGLLVNDFGVGGILDIPSARMGDEGTLTTTYSRKDVADIYAVGYQVLPRVEATFRYSINNARKLSPVPGTKCEFGTGPLYGCDDNRDRSFEVKFKLLEESEYLPQVAVGIRDLLGTGQWGAEYLVASKRVGPNLDLTAGIGWGRLAERDVARNPLISIDDRFAVRTPASTLGGQFTTSTWFRGPRIGAFGGIRYSIPRWRIDLLAAYNSDSYARERALNTIPDAKPVSFGLEWEATPGVRLGASWQQGNQLALKISASLDTRQASPRKAPNGFGAERVATAPPAELERGVGWWPRMTRDAEASGLLLYEYKESPEGKLQLRYGNSAYQVEADAIRRLLALADLYAPTRVTEVSVTGESLGLPTHTVKYRRPNVESAALLQPPGQIELLPPQLIDGPDERRGYKYPNGSLDVGLDLRTYLFDPDFPLLYQLSASFRGTVDFGSGWSLSGRWVQNITSQFDRIKRPGGSALPPVRTDQIQYLQQGKSGIDNLALVKRGNLARDVYYQAYAGILEEMYSGVGGEVLWRPFDRPFAVGVNLNAVQQREFDKRFGLRDYKTLTGHVSLYWATPWYDFDVAVHTGRYLAKDFGSTLEIQKRFANGWSVGAFATLTDVPFEVFGEGSFDKGLIFRIPFDLYSTKNTRGAYRTIIRPINRDGGRMLDNWPGSLWENMRDTMADRLRRNADRVIPE
jgi:hypothetical protein